MTVPVSAAGAAAGNQTGGQQQGAQQNQQGADGGAGQQGSQQQGGSLLDEEADAEHQQEQTGGQQGGQQSGQPEALTMEGIARLVESTIDRRINAVVKEVRGTPNGQRQDQQQNGGQQVQQEQQPQQQQPTGPSRTDFREARAEYKDRIADEIKFLGNAERDLAGSIAAGVLQQRLIAGDDPETAGSAAANEVAKVLKDARRLYEDRTVSALKRKGLLPDEGGRPGQPTPGPTQPGAQSGYAAGAAKAKTLLAGRMPQTQQQ